ncbi:MAG: RluA family pseudouridine synthase [Oscillospiraceae bacterium]|nr:RluA family pseudouridine synthase [Oscillospiraceae bacterium]
MTNTYTIKAQESGERIDALLAQEIEEITRSQVVRLIAEGAVTLRCAPIKKNHRVTAGEIFVVEIPEAEETEIVAENISLDIAFEDDDLVVVNKPRGMVVHPAPGHSNGTLVNALLWHCGESLSGIGGEKRPGIVHRIDMDTSGLLIVAKNDYAHRFLSAQLVDHSLSRTYEAVVCGRLKDNEGIIDAPLGRHPNDRKRMAVTERNSKNAVTHYEVIARYDGYTHVRCRLETGRTHQIRVHMAYIGHPLLGDMVYGRKRAEKGLEGQCLHAKALRFIHPRTNELCEVTSELPDYFTDVLSRLGDEIS